jgi:hypothetical protein
VEPVVLRFPCPTRPLSVNESNTMHYATRARRLKPWQDAAWALAHNVVVRGWTPKPVDVQVCIPFGVARRRDAHNYTGTVVKAVVDGLVRARLVPDDVPQWVRVLDPVLSIQPEGVRYATVTITERQP